MAGPPRPPELSLHPYIRLLLCVYYELLIIPSSVITICNMKGRIEGWD